MSAQLAGAKRFDGLPVSFLTFPHQVRPPAGKPAIVITKKRPNPCFEAAPQTKQAIILGLLSG